MQSTPTSSDAEQPQPFPFQPVELQELVKNKNTTLLQEVGGVEGLAAKLNTSTADGLLESPESRATRDNYFGKNVLPEPPHKSLLRLWFETIKDVTLIILIIAAVVSVVLGAAVPNIGYTDYCVNVTSSQATIGDNQAGWIEGAAILLAVLVVSGVTAGNDYSKELKFRALSKKEKVGRKTKVLRKGLTEVIYFTDVTVGDVVSLDTGDEIPADGLYIRGFDLKLDESQMSGEALPVKKNTANPFILSGCKVTDGSGFMLVTSVGVHTEWGKTMSSLEEEKRDTPLQENLDALAGMIGKLGMCVALVVFVVLFFWWLIPALTYSCEWVLAADHCVHAPSNYSASEDNGHLYTCLGYDWSRAIAIVDYIITAVTVVVVAVPEGLPLAVTISLAYSMKQMYADKNLVRHLKACETMSNCTNICSDKTGTLTENCMTVVRGWLAGNSFSEVPPDFRLKEEVLNLVAEGIALNSATSSTFKKLPGMPVETIGNKTECALLLFASALGYDYQEIRNRNVSVYQRFTFSSARKRMSTLIWLDRYNNLLRMYVKGAPEIILRRAVGYVNSVGVVESMTDKVREQFAHEVEDYAQRGLRTLCLAYRDLPAADPEDAVEPETLDPEDLENDLGLVPVIMDSDTKQAVFARSPDFNLVIYALFGIHDPVRPEVAEAVLECQSAGITVRMVTGDNVATAKHIAEECHILTPDGLAMEGPDFDKLTDKEVDEILPRLQVLARSAPSDKRRLVHRLIENGEVVAVTGDGTNDVQALKEADVGLAMGLRGTDIAKQASDIVILDDNFKSIVKAVMWGRSVYDNIRKFLQFQLTVNIVALAIVVIGAISQRGTPLKAIQLLWVNMIMDTMAALALGTEKPTPALLQRKPFGRYDRLISNYMIRTMIVQASYQLTLLLVFLYAGRYMTWLDVPCAFTDANDPLSTTLTSHCCVDNDSSSTLAYEECPGNPHKHVAFDSEISAQTTVLETVIFNTFVFCQVFNEINSRKVNNEWNVWEKIWTNWMFGLIVGITMVFQVLIICVTGKWMGVAPMPGLNGVQWVTCLVPAVLTLPIGLLVTRIPVPQYRPRMFKPSARKSLFAFLRRGKGEISPDNNELDLLKP